MAVWPVMPPPPVRLMTLTGCFSSISKPAAKIRITEIHAAAGGPGHDELDGTIRKGRGGPGSQQQCGRAEGGLDDGLHGFLRGMAASWLGGP